jgi:hypothetical protein
VRSLINNKNASLDGLISKIRKPARPKKCGNSIFGL